MNRQIGWSQESNLLWQIGNQIDRFEKVIFTSLSNTVPSSRTLTINGVTYDLSADRSWTVAAGISGSGAAGQVAYWTGASSQSGNNNFFWGSVNYRLGIGTNTPSASLRISRAAAGDIISTGLASAVTFSVYSDGFTTTQFLDSVNYIKTPTYRSRGTNLSFASEVGTIYARIFEATGNLVLQNGGTFTDGGQRLQVAGDALISNSSASGTFFEVKRTGTTDRYFRVLSTGNIEASSISIGDPNFQFLTGVNNTSTTGDRRFFWLQNNFSPTSGTATYRTLELTTIINQTGGANGITRGLNINPTLTAAFDWRSIQWDNNTGWGLYGQGTADNFLGGGLLINGVFRETITTNRQTASYTLALADRGKLVEMNVATANNLTVPLDSAVAFPIGSKIDISQYGAGQTTVVATGGVTIRSAAGALKLAVQYSGASLVKIATNEWYLFGDITT